MNESKHALGRRRPGASYEQTRNIRDLRTLALHIQRDLVSGAGSPPLPDDVQFSMLVIGGVILHVTIGGLRDGFSYADPVTHRLSEDALNILRHVYTIVESYNWFNPDDPTDRRFFCAVYVAPESEHRGLFWITDVLSIPLPEA